MNCRRCILLVLAILVCALACVREANINLPDLPTRIVALSHFTIGQPIQVEVSLSQTLTDAGDPVIPFEANVSIAVGGKFLDKLFRVTDDGGRIFWQSRDTVEAETQYAVTVQIGGYDPAQSESYAPQPKFLSPSQIDTAGIRILDLENGKLALQLPLVISVADLPADKRYFAFGLKHEIEIFELINGEPVPDEYYEASSKFLADGRTLALVYDTPENVVLINENFWQDDSQQLSVDVLIPFDPAYERPRRVFVEWRTLSEDFYRYHLSLARQGNNIPLNDPDALYNNIEGGYGNFSGYSATEDTIRIPELF
ncbi:MAG: DUF4249 family protein [Bacteroidetes bacterium]|nr:MAG: DUF4249 family protein [Bacteroidota bacterium]